MSNLIKIYSKDGMSKVGNDLSELPNLIENSKGVGLLNNLDNKRKRKRIQKYIKVTSQRPIYPKYRYSKGDKLIQIYDPIVDEFIDDLLEGSRQKQKQFKESRLLKESQKRKFEPKSNKSISNFQLPSSNKSKNKFNYEGMALGALVGGGISATAVSNIRSRLERKYPEWDDRKLDRVTNTIITLVTAGGVATGTGLGYVINNKIKNK